MKKTIADFIAANGYSPTYAQIGELVGLTSPSTVYKHVNQLVKKGHLKHDFNVKSSLDIVIPVEGVAIARCPKCKHVF